MSIGFDSSSMSSRVLRSSASAPTKQRALQSWACTHTITYATGIPTVTSLIARRKICRKDRLSLRSYPA